MKKISKGLIFGVIILAVGSCVGKTVLLRNDKGDIAKCEVSAGDAMLGGAFIRDRSLSNCVQSYEAAGYKKISE